MFKFWEIEEWEILERLDVVYLTKKVIDNFPLIFFEAKQFCSTPFHKKDFHCNRGWFRGYCFSWMVFQPHIKYQPYL